MAQISTMLSEIMKCEAFVDCIGKEFSNILSENRKTNFYNDATEDQECFYVLLFNPHSMEKQKHEMWTFV